MRSKFGSYLIERSCYTSGGLLADDHLQSGRKLAVLKTQEDAEWDMIHASVWDLTGLQLQLDAEQQKRQSVGRTIRVC